jgi:PAS domain S-box-containing protein
MQFQDLPIKRKVMAVMMTTSVTVLLITSAAFMIYDLVTFRSEMLNNFRTMSSLLAYNSTAALAFRNDKIALEVLAAIDIDKHIVSAALYDDHNNIYVHLPANEPISSYPLTPGKPGARFENGYLIAFAPVAEGETRMGTVYLKSDLGALYERLRVYGGIALLVVLGSLLVALVISNALQERISRPILALAETAKVISERRDFSVRAQQLSGDELGTLNEAFNQMLTRIQEQTVALRDSEEQLRIALEASRTGTWNWNIRNNTVSLDEYSHTLYGLQPGGFGGSYDHFLSLVHPEDRTGVTYAVTQAIDKKTDFNSEFRVVWPDGSVHYLAARGKAFYDDGGQPIRMSGVTLDITERKYAEEIRSFLAAIVDSSDDAIIGKSLEGKILSWNSGAQRMFGYTEAEMIGQSVLRLVSPERPEEEGRILKAIREGQIRHYETLRVRKDGQPIDVSLTVSPIRNARGEIIGGSSISRDVTERKRVEQALERQAAVLREQAQMLDLANVMARDIDDHIILWNSGMEKMYGWSKSEALGKVSHELLRAKLPQPMETIHSALIRDGHWEGELVHFRKDGRPISVASQWVVHIGENGQPAAILEINNDITERKQAEDQVLRMNVELEQRVQERTAELTAANREMEAFTYSVAHDLRAPLRHIDAFSKILHEDFSESLPSEAQRYLDNIRNGSRNMSRLVDDLLNLARVGRQELKRQRTQLGTLVDEVLTDLKRETQGRAIEWRIHPLPAVDCDSGLMKQVFANLLANAVKYTRPRNVAVIEVGHMKMDGDTAVFVRDNGVGFNMKYADKLFGVFQRLHRAEDFEGTGVGLATVDRIVRKHGGSIWAEAAIDKGATFYFTVAGLDKNTEEIGALE